MPHRRIDLPADGIVTMVACADDLRHVLVATGNPGRVIVFEPGGTTGTRLADREAGGGLVSPDGSRVAVAFFDTGHQTVYRIGGRALFEFTVGDSGHPDFRDPDFGPFQLVQQSRDGSRIVGAVPDFRSAVVVDAASGAILRRLSGVAGPVALDRTGILAAYADRDGQITVCEVDTGTVVSTRDSGLATVNALCFAPDGTGLVAGGASAADDELSAVSVLISDDIRTVVVADPELDIMEASPFARFGSRASWPETGPPLVFFADDEVAVLVDGFDGRVLWRTDSPQTAGGFSPDGRLFLASGGQDGGPIDVWLVNSFNDVLEE